MDQDQTSKRKLSCCDGRHVTWPVDHSLIGLISDRADSLMFPIFKMTYDAQILGFDLLEYSNKCDLNL